MTEYLKLGKIVATFGLKGELVLSHFLGKRSTLKDLKTVFTEEGKGSFIPWFISSARIKNENETIILLEGINTREAAMKLVQKEAWLPDAEFKRLSASSSPVNLLGYSIVEDGQVLGIIQEVIDQPHQLLCRIEIKGKEAYIPLHQDSMIKIDRKKKQVIVALPPGLLEIYL